MILMLLFSPFIGIIKFCIGLLPTFSVTSEITGFFGLLHTALQFFPTDVWIVLISNIVFWVSGYEVKGIINFILGVLPFVNIRFGG